MCAETERASGGCIRIAEAAAHEGALLQMQDGSMWTYASRDHEGLVPCGPGANFPVPCPFMVPTPQAAQDHLGQSCHAVSSCLPLLALLCQIMPWQMHLPVYHTALHCASYAICNLLLTAGLVYCPLSS